MLHYQNWSQQMASLFHYSSKYYYNFIHFFNHQYPQRAWHGVEINCLLRLDFNSDCHDLCGLGLHLPNLLPLLLQVLRRLGEERRQPRLWIILLYGWCDGGGFFNNHHKSLFIYNMTENHPSGRWWERCIRICRHRDQLGHQSHRQEPGLWLQLKSVSSWMICWP